MKDYTYSGRKYILAGAVILLLLVYLFSLMKIQLDNEEYKMLAEKNALYLKTTYPDRGLIYDRNGKLLVYNQPSYDITFIPRELKKLDTLAFCNTLGITLQEFNDRVEKAKDRRLNPGYSTFTEQDFMTQLSAEEYASIQEKLHRFHGFYVKKRAIRQYNCNSAGVLLGDIGQVSQKKIDKDPYYKRGDYIGTQGLESSYEHVLRGKKGTEVYLRNAHGRIQGSYRNGECDTIAVRGKDITLSLDIELQELGERLMENKIGSIVAIEPETGEILCMVSSPYYDPTLLTGRERGKNHIALSKDIRKPLMNRAIMGAYPPGSTFKTSQALTFLEEGIVTPETAFPCHGGFPLNSNRRLKCHAHSSPTALKPAIATSCNAYFCYGLQRMLTSKKYKNINEAMNIWRDYMVSMGFGYRLGVDLPGEESGMIPNAEYYSRKISKAWKAPNVISISIGQGEVTLTPLQIANLGATIANRGTYIIPHVVKEIEGEEIDIKYRTPKKSMADTKVYEDVVKGMRHAVTNGTCRAANIPGIEVCGKTGTAQNKGKDHSAFMGFAPMDKPEIAIAVYVENGGFGARFGVPIGALIMEKYLKGELSEESEAKAKQIQETVIDYGTEER
ncbi:MAG: penicillin-binding protein 2 [Bacteroidaceae bacterium]|nr:penicillin-binding protein 2 [Bacteroidaceae bacterium]